MRKPSTIHFPMLKQPVSFPLNCVQSVPEVIHFICWGVVFLVSCGLVPYLWNYFCFSTSPYLPLLGPLYTPYLGQHVFCIHVTPHNKRISCLIEYHSPVSLSPSFFFREGERLLVEIHTSHKATHIPLFTHKQYLLPFQGILTTFTLFGRGLH